MKAIMFLNEILASNCEPSTRRSRRSGPIADLSLMKLEKEELRTFRTERD